MKRIFLSILPHGALLTAALLAAACRGSGPETADTTLVFGALLRETDAVRTRSDFKTEYIESENYNMDFYIRLDTQDENKQPVRTTKTYRVPSGYMGRLEVKPENGESPVPLNWETLTEEHTFHAWNVPWDEEYTPTEEDFTKGIPLEFKNSSEAEGYAENHNNHELETFIAAQAGPYTYLNHGKYVEFTFFHMVSKIKIGTLALIQSDGSIQKNLKADVTFVGMPTKATFYPAYDGAEGKPYVEPGDIDPDDGITYYIANDAVGSDVFYICPETDFRKIDFKVRLNNEEYKDYDTYYGTFEDVVFTREPGSLFDKETGGDEKILHAGEMMTLNINLIPGIGPGLSIVISDWSTDPAREAQYHTYPGLYSDAEVNEMLDAFKKQKQDGSGTTAEEIESLFEMYGEERDGKKYFTLYDNVDVRGSADANIFPIPSDYILDGMGHTITLKSNRGSNVDFGSTQIYFNIGQVVDVWITDGTNTIYVDKDGYVWIYDKEKQDYVPTKHRLEPLKDPYKSYDISCETGIVHQSTYYNSSIVGS